MAGVGLAVSDINAVGGVNDAKACHDIQDSGDSTDMSVSTSSAGIARRRQAVGRHRRSLVERLAQRRRHVRRQQDRRGLPANTAVDLSGYSPYYFRTAPPDGIQGNALGTLISTDGYKRVAFLVFNDTYGTGLRNAVQETVEPPAARSCTAARVTATSSRPARRVLSEVSGALAANPDAIVILAFDETKQIVPELRLAGWDMTKTYFSDGNTADYSKDFEAGTLEGAQGTIPGADPEQGFKDRLSGWSESAQGEPRTDYAYGAESYDATILAALAAVKGAGTDSQTIQENYAAVSGATDGEERTSTRTASPCWARARRSGTPVPPAPVRSTTRTTRRPRSSASTRSTPTTRTS